ncbi:MAG: BON domain-containing protein [Planctomycetaceae bacterium]|nr:BON domain-containing protein [Planctomycetaceae bacterium]
MNATSERDADRRCDPSAVRFDPRIETMSEGTAPTARTNPRRMTLMQPNTTTTRRTIKWALLAATLSVALVAPALAAPSDMWITAKSRLALLTAEGVPGTAISVDTVNQTVTLHGKVESAAAKAKAESVVKSLDGVTGVRNLLAVVPASVDEEVERSDDDIEKRVNTALQAHTSLRSTKVTSVNAGVVLLGGSTTTMTDHLSAVEIASGVAGVREVASKIESPDSLADAEIWREREEKVADSEYGVVDSSRDIWITSMAKMRLMANGDTPAMDINVDTRNGVVTLFGVVPTAKAKEAAEADVRKVGGVVKVNNDLQVVTTTKQPAMEVSDNDIQREVEKRFEERTSLKDVDIAVVNCVVRLTGTVPSGTQRLEAAVLARSTNGVCSVQDDLRIE